MGSRRVQFFFLKKERIEQSKLLPSSLLPESMVSAMESRIVLVDISRAMGKDLEVAKKQLHSTLHRTFQVTWRANSSSEDCEL